MASFGSLMYYAKNGLSEPYTLGYGKTTIGNTINHHIRIKSIDNTTYELDTNEFGVTTLVNVDENINVRINDVPAKKYTIIKDGDHIEFGKIKFKFVHPSMNQIHLEKTQQNLDKKLIISQDLEKISGITPSFNTPLKRLQTVNMNKRRFSTGSKFIAAQNSPKLSKNILLPKESSTPENPIKSRFSQRMISRRNSTLAAVKENEEFDYDNPKKQTSFLSIEGSAKKNKTFSGSSKYSTPIPSKNKTYSGNISDVSENVTTPENTVTAASITPLNVSKKKKSLNASSRFSYLEFPNNSSTPKSAMKVNRSVYRPLVEDITPASPLPRSSLRNSSLKKTAFTQRRSVNFDITSASDNTSGEALDIPVEEEGSSSIGSKRKRTESISDYNESAKKANNSTVHVSDNEENDQNSVHNSSLSGIQDLSDTSLTSNKNVSKVISAADELKDNESARRENHELEDQSLVSWHEEMPQNDVDSLSSSLTSISTRSKRSNIPRHSNVKSKSLNLERETRKSVEKFSKTWGNNRMLDLSGEISTSSLETTLFDEYFESSVQNDAEPVSSTPLIKTPSQSLRFKPKTPASAPRSISLITKRRKSFSLSGHPEATAQVSLKESPLAARSTKLRKTSSSIRTRSKSLGINTKSPMTYSRSKSLILNRRRSISLGGHRTTPEVSLKDSTIVANSTELNRSKSIRGRSKSLVYKTKSPIPNPRSRSLLIKKIMSATINSHSKTTRVSVSGSKLRGSRTRSNSLGLEVKSRTTNSRSKSLNMKGRISVPLNIHSKTTNEVSFKESPIAANGSKSRRSMSVKDSFRNSLVDSNDEPIEKREPRTRSKSLAVEIKSRASKLRSKSLNPKGRMSVPLSTNSTPKVSVESPVAANPSKSRNTSRRTMSVGGSFRNSLVDSNDEPVEKRESRTRSKSLAVETKSRASKLRSKSLNPKGRMSVPLTSHSKTASEVSLEEFAANLAESSISMSGADSFTSSLHDSTDNLVERIGSRIRSKSLGVETKSRVSNSRSKSLNMKGRLSVPQSNATKSRESRNRSKITIPGDDSFGNSVLDATDELFETEMNSPVTHTQGRTSAKALRSSPSISSSIDSNLPDLSKNNTSQTSLFKTPKKLYASITKASDSPGSSRISLRGRSVINSDDSPASFKTSRNVSFCESVSVADDMSYLDISQASEMVFKTPNARTPRKSVTPKSSSKYKKDLTDVSSTEKLLPENLEGSRKSSITSSVYLDESLASSVDYNSETSIDESITSSDVFTVNDSIRSPQTRRTSIRRKTPKNDLTDIAGVKELLKTPRVPVSPKNDLTDVRGVRELLKTPRVKQLQNTPRNDLTDVGGVKKLLRTPKIQKTPNNDLTNIAGVKNLLKTPKVPKSPNNDLTNIGGVKALLKTPKVQKSPANDLTNIRGVKKLLKTPKEQKSPENDLTNVAGVKKLLKTPKPKRSPKNDLREIKGLKKLLSTPKPQNSPRNDLTNITGVKKLMTTPRVRNSPRNDLTQIVGVKKLMASPKQHGSPKNDLTNVKGVKNMFMSPKQQKEPKNDLMDVRGVRQLLRTPKNKPADESHDLSGVDILFDEENEFDKLVGKKQIRTYSRSPRADKSQNTNVVEESNQVEPSEYVLEWLEDQSKVEVTTEDSATKGRKRKLVDTSEALEKSASNKRHKSLEKTPKTACDISLVGIIEKPGSTPIIKADGSAVISKVEILSNKRTRRKVVQSEDVDVQEKTEGKLTKSERDLQNSGLIEDKLSPKKTRRQQQNINVTQNDENKTKENIENASEKISTRSTRQTRKKIISEIEVSDEKNDSKPQHGRKRKEITENTDETEEATPVEEEIVNTRSKRIKTQANMDIVPSQNSDHENKTASKTRSRAKKRGEVREDIIDPLNEEGTNTQNFVEEISEVVEAKTKTNTRGRNMKKQQKENCTNEDSEILSKISVELKTKATKRGNKKQLEENNMKDSESLTNVQIDAHGADSIEQDASSTRGRRKNQKKDLEERNDLVETKSKTTRRGKANKNEVEESNNIAEKKLPNDIHKDEGEEKSDDSIILTKRGGRNQKKNVEKISVVTEKTKRGRQTKKEVEGSNTSIEKNQESIDESEVEQDSTKARGRRNPKRDEEEQKETPVKKATRKNKKDTENVEQKHEDDQKEVPVKKSTRRAKKETAEHEEELKQEDDQKEVPVRKATRRAKKETAGHEEEQKHEDDQKVVPVKKTTRRAKKESAENEDEQKQEDDKKEVPVKKTTRAKKEDSENEEEQTRTTRANRGKNKKYNEEEWDTPKKENKKRLVTFKEGFDVLQTPVQQPAITNTRSLRSRK